MSFLYTVVEQTSRGERAFDIYSRLLDERIVFLGTRMDTSAAKATPLPWGRTDRADALKSAAGLRRLPPKRFRSRVPRLALSETEIEISSSPA